MNELRKDYFLDRWVLIAENRSKRPQDFAEEQKSKKKNGICYFCRGNEGLTPPEICRVEKKGSWTVRCFPNKFPATIPEFGKLHKNFLTRQAAYGRHEIVVETPTHGESLSDLSVDHIRDVLSVYSERIKDLKRDRKIKYVMIIKNEGLEGGASIEHSHTQIFALPIVPTLIREEIYASKRYTEKKGECPFCKIVKVESRSKRRILSDKNFIAFAPFASRFPFETWIMPKRHVTSIEFLTDEELYSFAGILKNILMRLNSLLKYPPYNFYLHVSPEKEDLHFHLELCPRVSKLGGFELGSDIVINIMPPEIAAEHYRVEV